MEYVIRDAMEADRPGVTDVIVEAFYDHLKHAHPDKAVLGRLLAGSLVMSRFVVAADASGKVAGAVGVSDAHGYAITLNTRDVRRALGMMRGLLTALFMKPELERPRRFEDGQGHVDFVAVRERARRQGLAGRMLAQAMTRPGYRVFTLEVVQGNEYVLPLYQAAGFAVTGREQEKHRRLKGFAFRYLLRRELPSGDHKPRVDQRPGA